MSVLTTNLVQSLRAAILGGRYGLGTVLLQADLASEFGVSRIPVRDALQRLAADNLVELVPGKGARITCLTASDLDEIFDLRVILECDLLRRAIMVATPKDHEEVSHSLKKSSLEAGRPGWHGADWDFHRTLYQPAQRVRQLKLIEDLRANCVLFASGYSNLVADADRWLTEHTAIAGAYSMGEADKACAILLEHIRAAHARLV
ncbi:MAG: GntR family transcriptional regulator, partial [Sphingorhabdus sp.]|uniref:GntR family transcriptional regulator n=1 Tax=Sphingorhabdus sp. TaxID=1902408 RepID=UPI003C89DEB9